MSFFTSSEPAKFGLSAEEPGPVRLEVDAPIETTEGDAVRAVYP